MTSESVSFHGESLEPSAEIPLTRTVSLGRGKPPMMKNLNMFHLDLSNVGRSFGSEEDKRKQSKSKIIAECSKIAPGVLLSSDICASSLEELRLNKISHIVNCAGVSSSNYFEAMDEFRYLKLSLSDGGSQPLFDLLFDVFDFITEALKEREKNGNVLVHCTQGVSRGGAVTVAYISWLLSLSVASSYAFVRSKRTIVSPNVAFMSQLINFDVWGQSMNITTRLPILYKIETHPYGIDKELSVLCHPVPRRDSISFVAHAGRRLSCCSSHSGADGIIHSVDTADQGRCVQNPMNGFLTLLRLPQDASVSPVPPSSSPLSGQRPSSKTAPSSSRLFNSRLRQRGFAPATSAAHHHPLLESEESPGDRYHGDLIHNLKHAEYGSTTPTPKKSKGANDDFGSDGESRSFLSIEPLPLNRLVRGERDTSSPAPDDGSMTPLPRNGSMLEMTMSSDDVWIARVFKDAPPVTIRVRTPYYDIGCSLSDLCGGETSVLSLRAIAAKAAIPEYKNLNVLAEDVYIWKGSTSSEMRLTMAYRAIHHWVTYEYAAIGSPEEHEFLKHIVTNQHARKQPDRPESSLDLPMNRLNVTSPAELGGTPRPRSLSEHKPPPQVTHTHTQGGHVRAPVRKSSSLHEDVKARDLVNMVVGPSTTSAPSVVPGDKVSPTSGDKTLMTHSNSPSRKSSTSETSVRGLRKSSLSPSPSPSNTRLPKRTLSSPNGK